MCFDIEANYDRKQSFPDQLGLRAFGPFDQLYQLKGGTKEKNLLPAGRPNCLLKISVFE